MLVAVLTMVAALGSGAIPTTQAWAQNTPAENDTAAKAAAPLKPAQEAPIEEPAAAEALSLHYRFIERYSPTVDSKHPELLTQYQVALLETQITEREKQQGAPNRVQFSRRTIYTERAAQVDRLGAVTSAIRRYNKFRMTELAGARAPKVPLFEGLTILYKLQGGERPSILNLTNDRPLREFEYSQLMKQVYLPQLTAVFPPTPRLVGDTWPISAKAAQSLVGELPSAEDYEMTGSLVKVLKAATGTALTAVISITGQLSLSTGPSSLNAEIHFVFNPSRVVSPFGGSGVAPKSGDSQSNKGGRRRDEGIMDARGHISRVLMAWRATNVLPEEEGRLKQTRTYELVLERKVAPPTSDANAPRNASLLPVPQPIPTATEANSWLLHEDPMERFHFAHPQNLELSPQMIDPNILELVDQNHATGKDVFILRLPPGPQDPQADRQFREVNQFQREIEEYWKKAKVEILKGPAGWLPDTEWSPSKVFRKEIGVIAGRGADQRKPVERIYCDYYLVLSKGNQCFHVQSMTVRDDHVVFRTESEGIIKSFRFGKWGATPKAAAAGPAPASTPAN